MNLLCPDKPLQAMISAPSPVPRQSAADQPCIYCFGSFEVNFREGLLRKCGIRIKVQDQPLQVLEALLDAPGELVTREQLRERLWPSGTFVDFNQGLNTAVRKLRRALGDSASMPRYVETVARRGYRFVAPSLVSHGPRIHELATGPVTHRLPVPSELEVEGRPTLRLSHVALVVIVLLSLWLAVAGRLVDPPRTPGSGPVPGTRLVNHRKKADGPQAGQAESVYQFGGRRSFGE